MSTVTDTQYTQVSYHSDEEPIQITLTKIETRALLRALNVTINNSMSKATLDFTFNLRDKISEALK